MTTLAFCAEGPASCDNCTWRGDARQCGDVVDVQERLDAGGIVPCGECPECGALAYLDKAPPLSGAARGALEAAILKAVRGVLAGTAPVPPAPPPPFGSKSLFADGKTLLIYDHRGAYRPIGEARSARAAKRIAAQWVHGGDCGGFWFHKPTWGTWKNAASWSGAGYSCRRATLYQDGELAEALREGAL